MKIYTLTLSPAYDVHAAAESFAPFHENLARVTSRQAGGKGVNISRALAVFGVENQALILLGRENCGEFKEALQGLSCHWFEMPGRIRENLTLHCANAPETRISFTGAPAEPGALAAMEQAMEIDGETVVTFTGRVPDGIPMEQVKDFLKRLGEQGARIVLDSRSFDREDIFAVRPWLIKPNQEEISLYFGCQIDTLEQAAEKARVFAAEGVENVMISLGAQGALLLAENRLWLASAPAIRPISTIGAGDSSIAGFLSAAGENCGAADCLRRAVAFGSAACLQEGSLPPTREDVLALSEQITVKQMA